MRVRCPYGRQAHVLCVDSNDREMSVSAAVCISPLAVATGSISDILGNGLIIYDLEMDEFYMIPLQR